MRLRFLSYLNTLLSFIELNKRFHNHNIIKIKSKSFLLYIIHSLIKKFFFCLKNSIVNLKSIPQHIRNKMECLGIVLISPEGIEFLRREEDSD